MKYVFVEYELYGMTKNIIFNCFSQYSNWQWALNKLNDDDYSAKTFKIKKVIEERW